MQMETKNELHLRKVQRKRKPSMAIVRDIHVVRYNLLNKAIRVFSKRISYVLKKGDTKEHRILLLIMAMSTFLRLYQFPSLPAGLQWDEVSAGYETYALLLHGTDRWGNPFPVYFPSWGSGQNVLLSYLNMPFIAIFGLTAFGERLSSRAAESAHDGDFLRLHQAVVWDEDGSDCGLPAWHQSMAHHDVSLEPGIESSAIFSAAWYHIPLLLLYIQTFSYTHAFFPLLSRSSILRLWRIDYYYPHLFSTLLWTSQPPAVSRSLEASSNGN